MAKAIVYMPDDLLAEIDAEARRIGTSRSAVMCRFARGVLDRNPWVPSVKLRRIVREVPSDPDPRMDLDTIRDSELDD